MLPLVCRDIGNSPEAVKHGDSIPQGAASIAQQGVPADAVDEEDR